MCFLASVRLAVVLSGRGGALAKMKPAFALVAGGPLGNPDAWFPWIHEDDATGTSPHRCTARPIASNIAAFVASASSAEAESVP